MPEAVATPERAAQRIARAALWYTAGVAAALAPLLVAPASSDRFRLPKELLLRTEGILLIAIALLAIVWRAWPAPVRFRDPVVALAAAAVTWVAITAALSNNHHLSAFALLRVASVTASFLAVYLLAPRYGLRALAFLLLPAIPNIVLLFMQRRQIWNPFLFEIEVNIQEQSTALIGNPNDVGSYLIVPALVALTLAVAVKRMRALTIPLAAITIGGLLINMTLTALVAFAAAALTLAVTVSRRRLVTIGVLAVVSVAAVLLYTPLRTRLVTLAQWAAAGQFDAVLTGRTTPYLTAAEMASRHPLAGVGPGVFRFEYYPYKLRVERERPALLTASGRTLNFGEAHNDHLQVAAETGLPGYALLLAALWLLARPGFARADGDGDPRRRFARLLAVPLAVALFVLMLAQFPLQLAAPTVTFTYAAALCAAWSRMPE